MCGGAWLRHGGPPDRPCDHGRPHDGRHARVAAGGAARERGRARLSRRAVRACDRALQLQERAGGQRLSTEHPGPRRRTVPPQEVQGPDDEGWRVHDHSARAGCAGRAWNERAAERRPREFAAERRPRQSAADWHGGDAAADSAGPATPVLRRSAAGCRRRHHRRTEQEPGELAAIVPGSDAIRPVAVRLQQCGPPRRTRTSHARRPRQPARAQYSWRKPRESRRPRQQHDARVRVGLQSRQVREPWTRGNAAAT